MPVRIVLVEDAEADVYLVREALEQCGLSFDLSVLEDGEKAVKFVEHADLDPQVPMPQLMLLDLNLPRRSGGEVLARLRQSQRFRELPVVILTSSESPADKAIAARFTALYFRKPSRLDEFMKLGALVQSLLGAGTASAG